MLPALPFQKSKRDGVIEEIGQGGHAIVFRAYDRSLSRDVAVKMLREDVSFTDIRAQFAQAHTLAHRLEHEPQLPHNTMTRTSAADIGRTGST